MARAGNGDKKPCCETERPPFFVLTREAGDPALFDADKEDAAAEAFEALWERKWKEAGKEPPGPLFVLPPGWDLTAVLD